MTRRQRHNGIILGITITFIVGLAIGLINRAGAGVFMIGSLAYVCLLTIVAFVCFLDVPRSLRCRPDKPSEFSLVRPGPLSDDMANLLGSAEIAKEGMFSGRRHQLFRINRSYPEGVWTCEIEVADEIVLARATSFQSRDSPVLDRGEQVGAGRFIRVDS